MAGAAKKVAIVTDELLKDIEKGKIEFDILVTSPAFMPKLAKFAKVLGPKGLMPSPKAGTVTPDPEKKAKEFEAGKTVVKAEAKFPLMHVTVGKINQADEELIANIKALLDAVKLKNVTKATLASTMSPGVKLQLN
jgi:large subunit ribosomal protein L1